MNYTAHSGERHEILGWVHYLLVMIIPSQPYLSTLPWPHLNDTHAERNLAEADKRSPEKFDLFAMHCYVLLCIAMYCCVSMNCHVCFCLLWILPAAQSPSGPGTPQSPGTPVTRRLPTGLKTYHLVMTHIAIENPLSMVVIMGTSSINGPFSMAMLNNQRVYTEKARAHRTSIEGHPGMGSDESNAKHQVRSQNRRQQESRAYTSSPLSGF